METLVHRAFQEISKPPSGFRDPELGNTTKQYVTKFLGCVEQLQSTTEFRAGRVSAGWASGGGAERVLADSKWVVTVASGLPGGCA